MDNKAPKLHGGQGEKKKKRGKKRDIICDHVQAFIVQHSILRTTKSPLFSTNSRSQTE